MYETLKTIIFSILIILIFHFILKHLLIQAEYMSDLKNIENMNIDNIEDNENIDNKLTNNTTINDMKDELLDFINSNNKGFYNKENTNYLKNYNIENNNNNNDNNNNDNLNNFFEKKNICEPDPVVKLKTKSGDFDTSTNQWNYENENIMNGGAIFDGLHGFDDTNDCWATCDIK